MKEPQRIVKNVSVSFIANILDRVIGFVIILLIARFLGDEGLGVYSFAFAFVELFSLFIDFGSDTLTHKEVARKHSAAKDMIGAIVSMRVVLGTLFIVVLPVIVFLVTRDDTAKVWIVLLAGLALLFDRLKYSFTAVFVAFEKVELMAVVDLSERVLALVLGVALMPFFGIVGLLTGFALSYLIALLIAFFITERRFVRFAWNFRIKEWLAIISRGWPYWFSILFAFIYFRLDTIMLSYFDSFEVVGWYNAAYSLVFALSFIPQAVVIGTFPVMSRYHQEGKSRKLLENLYRRSFRYLLIIALPVGIGATMLASRILDFIYGDQFANAAVALQILIWAEVFVFLNYMMGFLMNSTDNQKKFTFITGSCAVLNIVLNFILIPIYSYVGAAIATVVTYFINFLLLDFFNRRAGFSPGLLRALPRPILASAVLFGVVWLTTAWHLLIVIPLAGMAYFLVLLATREIGKPESDMALGFLKKK
ncbi:MAG: flippase [archaeon]